jgi:hypothetical protein
LFSAGRTFGQQKLHLVIAVDLTTSERIAGHDGQSQFEKNSKAVSELLGTVSAGSKIAVIGITDNSFGQPYILLSATISDDPGYFEERLASARRQLVNAWKKRSLQIQPSAKNTDILGCMLLAGELFRNEQGAMKMLIVYSDMRNTTNGVNFETARNIDAQATLAALNKQRLVPELPGVTVKVFGADASGLSMSRWNRLRKFWEAYFIAAGARLGVYSPLNEDQLSVFEPRAPDRELK